MAKTCAATGTSHFMRTFNGSVRRYEKGQIMTTSGPFEFSKYYKRPQFEGPIRNRARDGETDNDKMPESLSDLLSLVSKNSTGGIDSLIGEFEELRGRLRTDGERIQRSIAEYNALSQQVMEMTKAISESVEKVRASVDRERTDT